ncbi:MAG: hypothetical protein P1U42_12650 [Phycisphaerales bacterium]|nr:hypothetical protein [Phycisphaerales bacterium]
MNLLGVDRCVCHKISFATLIPIIESLKAEGISSESEIMEQLKAQSKCMSGCTMCEPYIRLVVHTGDTSFSPICPSSPDQ